MENFTHINKIKPNVLKFKLNNSTTPIISFHENGDIFVKGNKVENDLEVVNKFREFLNSIDFNKKTDIYIKDYKNRKDYLSVDKKTAISSDGDIFNIGDIVYNDEGDSAEILKFFYDPKTMDIIARTTKGNAKISFIIKNK